MSRNWHPEFPHIASSLPLSPFPKFSTDKTRNFGKRSRKAKKSIIAKELDGQRYLLTLFEVSEDELEIEAVIASQDELRRGEMGSHFKGADDLCQVGVCTLW